MLRYAMLRYVVLCYVTLRYVTSLRYVMKRYFVMNDLRKQMATRHQTSPGITTVETVKYFIEIPLSKYL